MIRKAFAICMILSVMMLFGCKHGIDETVKVEEIDDVTFDKFIDGIFGDGASSDEGIIGVLSYVGFSKDDLRERLKKDLIAHSGELKNADGSAMRESDIVNGLEANKDSIVFRVKSLKLEYPTDSCTGERFRASARMLVGYAEKVFDFWDNGRKWFISSNQLLLHNHGTIAKNAQAQTIDKSIISEGGLLYRAAFEGALVVDPDYEGYGSSSGRVHPYLIQDICAEQCIDAVEAAIGWKKGSFEGMSLHGLNENDENFGMYCFGYSQGGTMSLTVHNYIENKGLAEKLHFKGSLCGDGSYDLCETYKFFLDEENGGIYYPCSIPIILRSYLHQYGDSYLKGYTISDFLTPKVCEAIRDNTNNEWEIIDNKLNSTSDIDNKIAKALGIADGWDRIPVSLMFTEEARDLDSDISKAMMKAFEENSYANPNKWKNGKGPEIPVLAIHTKADEICPYVNMKNLKKLENVTEYEYNELDLDVILGQLGSGLEKMGWDADKISEVKNMLLGDDVVVRNGAHYSCAIVFYAVNILILQTYKTGT
ncbi:MAG TPA: hypothetical protein DCO86_04165 [Spirochaetaceae bacterium]|nr:hypothetical protein [Spirochaetaceae bacterium]